eukprot:13492062-Ditylum_brightwellii.AAC.1
MVKIIWGKSQCSVKKNSKEESVAMTIEEANKVQERGGQNKKKDKKDENVLAGLNVMKMYTKQKQEDKDRDRDPILRLLLNLMQQREDDRKLREQQQQVYRMDME